MRRIGQIVLAQQLFERHVVRLRNAPERLAGADVVQHAALDRAGSLTNGLVRAGAGERGGEGYRETRPGRSQRFSSSTSSCRVRSRCSGVTEMRLLSNTALQSLPGTFSCACSSPPIQ